jgi:transcriptional regulator with XRE-family HTH domain
VNLYRYEQQPRRSRMSRRVLRGFSPSSFTLARQRHGMSVSDLARLSDVGASTLFSWEAGRGTPQVDLLARVMKILDTPIEQVITLAAEERFPGDWRVVRGLTQPQLAAAVGIATTTLRGIERADARLTDANAAALAEALGITAEEYRAAWQRARLRPAGTSA